MMKDCKLVQERKFPFYIEPKLAVKLDLMIQRLDKADAWIIIDGDEGSGKTNMAAYVMEYISCKTGRPFTEDNFYFDAKQLFDKAKIEKKLILNWDEAALGGLSRQWWNRNQVNLMQFGMTGRIMHHFVVLCIPKFDKLGEYFIRDRSLALIHTYERGGTQKGRYLYYTKKSKERLWETYHRSKRRDYKKFASFHGSFCETIPKLIDEKKYEDKKLKAISEIGNDKTKERNVMLEKAAMNKAKTMYKLRMSGMSSKKIGDLYECTERTVQENVKRYKDSLRGEVVFYEHEGREEFNNVGDTKNKLIVTPPTQ